MQKQHLVGGSKKLDDTYSLYLLSFSVKSLFLSKISLLIKSSYFDLRHLTKVAEFKYPITIRDNLKFEHK